MSLFTDATAITITEGNVKNIQDSNGNMIWGSLVDYPYRRLEYIYFNGNDYIDTGYTPYNAMTFEIDCQFDNGVTNEYNGHGQVTSNNRAFIGIENSNNFLYGLGAYTGTNSTITKYDRHNYSIKLSSGSTGVFKVDDVTIASNITCNYVESNRGHMFIGGVYRSTGQYSLCHEKVYGAKFYNAGTLTWTLVPVQRKSDGAIGLLKVTSSTVSFMSTTNGNASAGPTVNEYWDGSLA